MLGMLQLTCCAASLWTSEVRLGNEAGKAREAVGAASAHPRSSRLRAPTRWNEAVVSDRTRFPGPA